MYQELIKSLEVNALEEHQLHDVIKISDDELDIIGNDDHAMIVIQSIESIEEKWNNNAVKRKTKNSGSRRR
jgi:hypothetical protein